ncbi:MAG: aminopeptidase [Spirochaetes bacterium]|nr:aminopeptidase [Spirochaetota bacterium]
MLTNTQLEKYADILIWGLKTARKEKFKKNDIILVQYDLPALNLAEILYTKILEMGIHPVQRMGVSLDMEKAFYTKANDSQLTFIAPGEKELYNNINGRIFLRAPESLTHLKDVDSASIGKVLVSRKPLRNIMNKREDNGVYSWTLCTMPTAELAKQAKASIDEYEKQIIRACYLDVKDPVAKWNEIIKSSNSIKKWLNSMKVKAYRVESQNTDLRITPGEKRKWIGVSGHNIPSFEIFMSPDWRGTEGTYYANFPSFKTGNYVEGIKLTFNKGAVTKVDAKKGREFTAKQVKMDDGASKVGEFSLTDKRFSRIDRFMADTLFDENFGGKEGNCHIALGASYSDTYDGNPADLTEKMKQKLGFNDSALHWDIVNTEKKTVTAELANGQTKVIYENGMFTC